MPWQSSRGVGECEAGTVIAGDPGCQRATSEEDTHAEMDACEAGRAPPPPLPPPPPRGGGAAAGAGVAPDGAADLLTRMASRGLIRGVRRPDGVRVFRQLLFLPGLFEAVYVMPDPAGDMEKLGALFEQYFLEG